MSKVIQPNLQFEIEIDTTTEIIKRVGRYHTISMLQTDLRTIGLSGFIEKTEDGSFVYHTPTSINRITAKPIIKNEKEVSPVSEGTESQPTAVGNVPPPA